MGEIGCFALPNFNTEAQAGSLILRFTCPYKSLADNGKSCDSCMKRKPLAGTGSYQCFFSGPSA